MASRNNVHFVQRDNGRGALREGGQRATEVFAIQAQTIQAVRQMARQGRGELLIHGHDSRIHARDFYAQNAAAPGGGVNFQGRVAAGEAARAATVD